MCIRDRDNHKGRWGNANDARDVILTDDFSESGIYEALRARRLYATEDKNLELDYTCLLYTSYAAGRKVHHGRRFRRREAQERDRPHGDEACRCV